MKPPKPRYHVADPLDAILCHMRGLNERCDDSDRNLFVSGGSGEDFERLIALEAGGFVERLRTPKFCAASDVVWRCTDLGSARARTAHNRAKPKLTRSQRRYLDFLNADCGASFGEWLRGWR